MSTWRRVVAQVTFLAVACFLFPSDGFAEEYRDQQRHYSLAIRQGWMRMPAAMLANVNTLAARLPYTTLVHYEAGFVPQGPRSVVNPYILLQVQSKPTAGLTYEQFEHDLTAMNNGRAVKNIKGSLGDAAQSLEMGSPALDRTRNRFLIRYQMDVAPVGRMQGLSVSHIGAEGVISLHCYAPQKDFQQYVPTFESITDSFRFDPRYEFKPATSPFAKVGRIVAIAALVAVLGGACAVIAILVRKSSRRAPAALQ